jgi:hypothetical protein
MLSRKVVAALRRLYGQRRLARPGHREALLGALLASYQERYPGPESSRRREKMTRALKFALAGAAAALLAVGACQVPVEYDMEIGQRLSFMLPGDTPHEAIDGIAEDLQGALPGVRVPDIMVLKRRGPAGDFLSVTLDLWGEKIDPDAAAAALAKRFPALAEVPYTSEEIEGPVRGTLGGKLGRELLHIAMDTPDIEAARQAVIDRLKAQGVAEPEVEITDEPDGRKFKIKVEGPGLEGGDTLEARPLPPAGPTEIEGASGDGKAVLKIRAWKKE